MTRQNLAALLHGREYGKEISRAEAQQAKAAGLVAAFGYSDDNLEFRGAVNEEIGAYEGATAVLYKGRNGWQAIPDDRKAIRDIEDDADLLAAMAATKLGRKVEAVWAPKQPNASWLIRTELPHTTFDIMDDGQLFCRGVVLDTSELT